MPNLKLSVPKKIVLIGASTGGPGQIQKLITALPKLNNTSVIIAQHMAQEFIPSFIKRLATLSANPVVMADSNKVLFGGYIYICSKHTQVIKNGLHVEFKQERSRQYAYNPDINVLFHSMVSFTDRFTFLGVILTGIGDDGVDGCKRLSEHNMRCLTETPQSAIVDGMPSRAREQVSNVEALSMKKIIETIKEFSS